MEKVILSKGEMAGLSSLPPTVERLIELEGTVCLAIKNGDRLLSYAILSEPGYGEKRILNHIYVASSDDTASLLSLYVYIKEYCSGIGLGRLICRFIDKIEGVNAAHRLMELLPQKPLLLNGHRLVYDMTKTSVEEILGAHSDIKKLLPFVKSSASVKGQQYNKFYEQLRKLSRAPYTVTKDEENDRYFEYRNQIIGFMNALRAGSEFLVMADSFVIERDMRTYAFPAMLASLLNAVDEDFKKTGRLVVQVYEEPVYRGTISMLGNPTEEELIFEYVMMF